MRALSVKQPYAEAIASGEKRIEYRTWKTHHRGDLLIVASKAPREGGEHLPCGVAICVVNVVNVTSDGDMYEWHLRDPRRVQPEPITGYAAIYNVADDRIVYVAVTEKARARIVTRARRPKPLPYTIGSERGEAFRDAKAARIAARAIATTTRREVAIFRDGLRVSQETPS